MTSDADCPSASLLEQLMLGDLSDGEAAPLERHLTDCGRCGSLASRIEAAGVLVEAMRVPSPILQETENPVVERLIGRLRGLRPGDTPSLLSTGENAVGGRAAEVELLEPAQEPGELGRLGSYRILGVLGSGGMGVVYQAAQLHPQRLVALKLSLGGQRRARLQNETDIVGRLPHPHIVPVYEAGEYQGRPYFTMEFLEGGSLAQKLAAAPLAPHPAAELVETLARAVQFAHERGIVHRDLKPSNVLLTRDGLAKIGDFGLAKQVEPDPDFAPAGCATESGAILGTPNYMAPEQAAGRIKEVGPAADTYALGAILYECLTGRPPFRAATMLETLEQVRTQEPVSLRRLQPGVPRDLETICLKCLEKEPRKRYVTAKELAEDLQRFLAGEPIQARPAGAMERLLKWARRKPALAALVGVCFLALTGMLAGAAVYERRLQHSLRETAAEGERADENYHQVRDTVQQMLARANAHNNAGIPKLQELRREQQEDALAFFLKMAEQQGDKPEVRFEVASAHHQVGLLHIYLGRPENALQNLRRAEEDFAALVAEFPQQGLYRFHLADTLKVLGSLAQLPPAEGENCLQRALALAEELVRQEPGSVATRSAEADIRITLGSFLYNQHKTAEAEDHYRRAALLYEELRREEPEASSHRQVLAKAYLNLSLVLQNGKHTREEFEPARAFHDKAEALLEQLRREQPDNDDVLCSLAALRYIWASVQVAERKSAAALADLAKSVTMLEEALQREPMNPELRDRLFRTHGMRGQIYEGQKRFAEAAGEFKRVVELSPDPAAADFRRLFLAMTHAKAGQYTRAVEVIEDWNSRATAITPLEQLLYCVGVYSIAVEAVRDDSQLPATERDVRTERYGMQAVALLRKLQERGYFKDPAHVQMLRTDEDLRLLRDREDFRKLLSVVEEGKSN